MLNLSLLFVEDRDTQGVHLFETAGCWRVGRAHWRGWQQLPQMIKRPAGNIWFAPIGKQHLMIGSWRKALHYLHNVIFVTDFINWHDLENSLLRKSQHRITRKFPIGHIMANKKRRYLPQLNLICHKMSKLAAQLRVKAGKSLIH